MNKLDTYCNNLKTSINQYTNDIKNYINDEINIKINEFMNEKTDIIENKLFENPFQFKDLNEKPYYKYLPDNINAYSSGLIEDCSTEKSEEEQTSVYESEKIDDEYYNKYIYNKDDVDNAKQFTNIMLIENILLELPSFLREKLDAKSIIKLKKNKNQYMLDNFDYYRTLREVYEATIYTDYAFYIEIFFSYVDEFWHTYIYGQRLYPSIKYWHVSVIFPNNPENNFKESLLLKDKITHSTISYIDKYQCELNDKKLEDFKAKMIAHIEKNVIKNKFYILPELYIDYLSTLKEEKNFKLIRNIFSNSERNFNPYSNSDIETCPSGRPEGAQTDIYESARVDINETINVCSHSEIVNCPIGQENVYESEKMDIKVCSDSERVSYPTGRPEGALTNVYKSEQMDINKYIEKNKQLELENAELKKCVNKLTNDLDKRCDKIQEYMSEQNKKILCLEATISDLNGTHSNLENRVEAVEDKLYDAFSGFTPGVVRRRY